MNENKTLFGEKSYVQFEMEMEQMFPFQLHYQFKLNNLRKQQL